MNLNLSQQQRVKTWQRYWAAYRDAAPTPTSAPQRRSNMDAPTVAPPPYLSVNMVAGCCGIRELNNLSRFGNEVAALKSFAKFVYDPSKLNSQFRFAVFSEANNYRTKAGYGSRFAAFIRENKLGAVIETEGWATNPNSGNPLKVWVWTVDHDAVKEWVKGVQ